MDFLDERSLIDFICFEFKAKCGAVTRDSNFFGKYVIEWCNVEL